MISRYAHPTVTNLWSAAWTYRAWTQIELEVLRAQRTLGRVPLDETDSVFLSLQHVVAGVDPRLQEAVSAIPEIERKTKHDVAAFLQWLRQPYGEQGKWIHFGLTSSDVVDTAQAMRFRQLRNELLTELGNLTSAVTRWTLDDTPLLGRTHGQPAEPTAMRARAYHWMGTLQYPITALTGTTRNMQRMKASGPVGTFAHNPPELEAMMAISLELLPTGPGASQIVPRSTLALWASTCSSLAAACAKIATDVRLMNMMEEVRWDQTSGQVGSSAMAHKNNPIVAEQICGLARLAAGYAQMLQPLDLWLERDISNSAVERVAVPDLWHILFRTIKQTTSMLESMTLDKDVADSNLHQHPEAWVHKNTLEEIRLGTPLEEARESAVIGSGYSDLDGTPPEWFMRQYPGAK